MVNSDLERNGSVRAVVDDAGTVLETDDYYPLGGPLPTGTSTALQPQKYQGKDWNPTASFNVYDFGARLYDPALGRWLSQDPLAEKYQAHSPYLFCAGNPMRFVDPEGSYFTEKSMPYVNQIVNYSYEQIFELFQWLSNLGSMDCSSNLWLQTLSNAISQTIMEYSKTIDEIATMAVSNQGYNIIITNNANSESDSDYLKAMSYYDFSAGLFNMEVPMEGVPGLIAHELKHGYQFEVGQFSCGETKGAGHLYDIEDEYEAYNRQALFQGGYYSPEKVSGLYDKLRTKNPLALQTLKARGIQDVVNLYKMAVRIDGKTYTYE